MQHELQIVPSEAARDRVLMLSTERLRTAKQAFATRRVDLGVAAGIAIDGAPRPGDILLAEVESVGHHAHLEDFTGRPVTLFEGDGIVVAFGDHRTHDQLEAHVPGDLGPCELVAAGGIAARIISSPARAPRATELGPVGILTDASGRRLNTRRFAIDRPAPWGERPLVVAVLGSSADGGRAQALRALINGEFRSGRRVAAIRATGASTAGDFFACRDAGAELVMDFTDAGFPTTCNLTRRAREDILATLLGRCSQIGGIDTALVEVAESLLIRDTARMVLSRQFRQSVDGIVFTGTDPTSVLAGADWLHRHGLPVLALSGRFTASPDACAEVCARNGLPILTHEAMHHAEVMLSDLMPQICAA